MRIKKIEIIGFKSFKDRTVIQFDAGITGVVGPNGCGKSNIVDALVWVMGEMSAKDLRGSTMSDVIFAGAEGYAPSGMAEVSLTLENDGGPFPAQYARMSEIMVTRRLHRSGESEYFVNKEPARLRDIQEVFMDTGAGSKGFSIIQQGMIGKIITAKPEDRRMLIEEAAGITKFKVRKRESQRKIQAADQNLLRLADIVGELKRQIDSLQRQAQKAEKYRELKNEIESLDLWVSSNQFKDLKVAADTCQKIFQDLQALETESESEVARLQSELETLKLSLLEQEKKVNEMQEQQFTKQSSVQKIELEIQSLKFEIEQARRSEQMAGSMFNEQKAREELLVRDLNTLEQQAKELSEDSQSLEAQFLEKNEAYQVIQSRITEVNEQLTVKRQELLAVGQTVYSMEAKLAGHESQQEDLQSRIDSDRAVLVELQNKKQEFEDRRKSIVSEYDRERQMQMDLANDVEAFEANRKALQDQISEKRRESEEFKEQLNAVTGKLYGLENLHQSFEGFEEGVKNVMLWQKAKQQEIHADGSVTFSPVSEVIEVPPDYEMAMEAALGTRLQTILSNSQDRSLEALDYLKSNKSGRTSFFMGEGSSGSAFASAPSGDGVRTLLRDVVSVPESQQSARSILDGVAVVDGIRTALRLRPEHPGWTFVTQDGDVLSADGILTGGSSEGVESGVLKRRREIKELSEQKQEWAGKLALVQASLKKLEAQLENVMSDFEGAQKRRVEQEVKVGVLRQETERAEREILNAEQAVTRQDRAVSQINEQLVSLVSKIEELQGLLTEAREKKMNFETESESLQSEYDLARTGIDGLQSEVTDLQVRSATKKQEALSASRQLEMVRTQVTDLQTQLSRMSEETEKNSTVATESQFKLEERKIEFERGVTELEELRSTLAQVRDHFEQQSAIVRELDEKSTTAVRARNDRQVQMNDAQIKFEQAKMKEQYLTDQIREKYMLNLPDVFEQHLVLEGRNGADSETQLKELREKLGRMGEVNLSAIEDYEETSKRYEFLVKQQEDLLESKNQLSRVVDRINKICSKRFKETFELVNERFTKVFPVLFGGGEAHLTLVEDHEKGEQGIEIVARPPGKKMQNISLLSGGEKALTAVSLVFAIFLVKPSPYCLLDEVDAPLDDANVYRFNDLVREMAKRSQIIVVTHNKHTMEVAKKLYGVTMQERGVSTMVSVNLAEIRNS